MPGPTTEYPKTALPSEFSAVPVSGQPFADIENHYNKLLRCIKEIWGCINGAATGADVNNTALTDYSIASNLGILPRLIDIEDNGKINDSAVIQIGAALAASDRGVRFTLGSTALYSEIAWNNSTNVFMLRDQAGALKRMQGATPTSTNDFTTKQYVDGLLGGGALKKLAICAPPVKTGNNQITMDYFYVANHDGTIFLTSSASKTCANNATGVGGMMASNTSKGISGTISVTSGSASVTGSGTTFTSDFQPGDLFFTAGLQGRRVLSVTNNTSMTTTTTFSANETNVSYTRGGVNNGNIAELNLYVVGDGAGINTGLALSTRNAVLGETVVDLPSVSKTGTVTIVSGQNTISGNGTLFLTEFAVGQEIVITGSGVTTWGTISEISSNTAAKISGTWGASVTSGAPRLSYNKYRQLPFTFPVNSSFNLHDFICSGFPWDSRVTLTGSDGTSDFVLLSGVTTTSTTALNLWLSSVTPLRVPKLCRRIWAKSYVSIVSFASATAPGQFQVGPTTGAVAQKTTSPSSQLYNSGSNTVSYTNNNYFDVDVDSSGNIQYKVSAGNTTAGLDLLGYQYTEWKG